MHFGGVTWRRLGIPVSSWSVAEWGTVAASWGMELMSGSGVLLGGEMASGVINILGFSCGDRRMEGDSHYGPDCDQPSHQGFKEFYFLLFTYKDNTTVRHTKLLSTV